MKYLYYPGCSLKGTGRAYEESLLPVFDALDCPMTELKDWNYCGATAYMSVDEMKAFALAARNLALAETNNGPEPACLVAPCNACYLVLNKVQKYMKQYADVDSTIRTALKDVGLNYNGQTCVRHPLDIMVNDIGLDKIKEQTKKPLEGLKVACYYGCQIVRPYADFDDQFDPQTMDQILQACGAETVDWPLKARCCGGTLTGTIEEAGKRMSYIILKEAKRRGADVIATICPLCQFNLECFQDNMKKQFDDPDIGVPVAYFSQLMGQAFGLDDKQLGLHRLFVPVRTATATA
jgi:heterodisulfide reductase subunit B